MEESSKLTRLKKEFLELLEKDVEFRYTVAGYLGLSEVLKRLDMLAEEQARVWGEISKVWSEIRGLREEQARLRQDMLEGFRRHDEEIKGVREEQA
ncbi:MAG: hypothetical protein NZ955_06430, partial [Candidatus Bathyarchaeota archaeon]|nr:hypothetical protein [Candidatus Bathyarchaeota archaeon]